MTGSIRQAVLLTLLVLLPAAVCADPAEVRTVEQAARQIVNDPEITLKARTHGQWALVDVEVPFVDGVSDSGQLLMRKWQGRWIRLEGARAGAFSSWDLYRLGMPLEAIGALYDGRFTAEQRELYRRCGPPWEYFYRREVEEEELVGYGPWTLTLMRNTIYARHGCTFQDPLLRDYFQSRPWYRPDPGFSEQRLSPVEQKNAATIQRYQQGRKLEFTP